jgi:signal transduction histidine kinase
MSSVSDNLIEGARRSQVWLRARPCLLDIAFAALIAIIALADLATEEMTAASVREPDALGVVLVLVGAAALIWRRSAPVLVLAITTGLSLIIYIRDYGSFAAAVGLAGLYAVAAHENNRRLAWAAVAVASVLMTGVASLTLLNRDDGFVYSNATSMVALILASIILGGVIRNYQEIFADTQARAERAEADRQAEAERAVARERIRIAREMHDVVAHGMSLIAVQAVAAQEIAETRPDEAVNLLKSIESTGRAALADMRRMLGALRNGDGSDDQLDRGELSPQPSLADLNSVIEHCNEAGIPTKLTISGTELPLPPGMELTTFRIVQEALTNVIKHGGQASSATVELRYEPTELRIVVADTGRGAASELTHLGAGQGLIGMRERVEIYDGELSTGPRSGGGYKVEAVLRIETSATRPSVASAEPKQTRSA